MPGSNLRLLALDGGGVRGLSALMILEQLMEAVNPDAPPKPCDYFDMIGGTSIGGLIAIMLGRLKMSVSDCITAYLSLSNRVFHKTRHRVTVEGQVQGRFDAEELARAVKEVVKQQGLQEDALLKDTPKAGCKVFVCATSKETSETVCFTSYRTPRGIHNATIWEACRATSAATSFFNPIAIGRFGEEFVDGAIGANNPVRELWNQAQQVWGPEPLENKVKCLVSIGTGVPALKAFKDDIFHIGETLVSIATETEMTAEQFRCERPLLDDTGRYYRFNVVKGLEDIGLEAKKVKEMAAATRRYISSQEVHTQMQACADNLAGRQYNSMQDWLLWIIGSGISLIIGGGISLVIVGGRSIDKGAPFIPVSSREQDGACNIPLCTAVRNGREQCVKTLVDNGADTNAKCKKHCFPLCSAVVSGNEQIVKMLTRNGGNVVECRKHGSLVDIAAERGQEQILEMLSPYRVK